MRSFNLSTLAIATFATALLCLQPQRARAGGEGFSKDDLGGKETVDTKSYDNVDLGKFKANPFHVSVSVRGGYDDNPNLNSFDEHGSAFVNVAGELIYQFGSPRTQLRLDAGGGFTYYTDRENNFAGNDNNDYDVNAFLSFAVTHKATPRLTLSANVYASYQSQPNFDTFNNGGVGFNRDNQNFFYSLSKFSATYLWAPRFATLTSYTLGVLNYDSDTISTFEDRYEHTFGNEFRFLLTPTTTLVAEYRFGIIDYSDSSNRDSTSHFFLAGFDHSFSPRFNISARGGVEFRQFDDNALESDRTDPYAEMTLNYSLAQGTTISWFNRYSLEQPDVPDSFSRLTYRTSLAIRHAFTSRISAAANVAYEHDVNQGAFGLSDFNEDDFDIGLTLRYAINRTWSIDVGYEHTEVISDDSFREFTRNRYFGGVTFNW